MGKKGRAGGRLHPKAFKHEKMSSHTTSLNSEIHLNIGKSNTALHENKETNRFTRREAETDKK